MKADYRQRAGAAPFARTGTAVAALLLLGACSVGRDDTAWQVIERQKQEQRMARMHEAEQMRERAPSEPRLMQSMIQETLAQGRYFAALAYIDAYVQRHGEDANVAALRARALRLTGQADKSEAAYRALLQGDRAAEAWHGLGLLAGGRGDFAQAAQDLQRAAHLAPTDADVLNDLGYARLRAGDLAGARIPLGQASELAPRNTRTLANLAVLLLAEGRSVEAQRLMDDAVLSAEVRGQIYRTVQQVQTGPLAASAPAAPAMQGGGNAALAHQRASGLPAVQIGQPLADRFNHSRMTQ